MTYLKAIEQANAEMLAQFPAIMDGETAKEAMRFHAQRVAELTTHTHFCPSCNARFQCLEPECSRTDQADCPQHDLVRYVDAHNPNFNLEARG